MARGFEGEGGKRQRKVWRPRTTQGVSFIRDVARGSQQFIRTLSQPSNGPPGGNHSHHSCLHGVDGTNYTANLDGNRTPPPKFVDHRVQTLAAYLQREDYMRRRMIEEQSWGEVYEKMFFQFYECAGKTSSWGNTTNWDQDWKPICQCTEF